MNNRSKVVLYNPRAVFWTMPLGLIAVGSALDPATHDVKIIDGRLEQDPTQAVLSQLDGAVCLGIGVLTGSPIRDALNVSRAVKAAYPNLPIVWGGWHPSQFPVECLAEPSVDITVSGQGEEAFVEVVQRLREGNNLDKVLGVTWRDRSGQIIQNPPRPTQDPNTFSPLNYDLISVEAYFTRKRKRQFDYISSVGCRFRCAFCADPYVYKRAWFGLTDQRIASELLEHSKRYRFAEVAFQDDTFFTRRERVEDICNAFLSAGLTTAWTGTMRADQGYRLPDETLALCRQAGLTRVMVGVEAGTDEMLKRIKKDITIAQVFDTAEKLVRHEIGGIWNFIVGFPDEPDESFEATLQIAKRLRAMSPKFQAAVFYYKPYPGNELAEQLKVKGYQFPATLEEWADFDYVGSAGPWVTPEKHHRVEHFKFYQKYAFGGQRHVVGRLLQPVARWRVQRDFYGFPIERKVIERLHPGPQLS